MSQHDRALDAQLFQGLVQQFGLRLRGPDRGAWAIAVAEARPVEDIERVMPRQVPGQPAGIEVAVRYAVTVE